MEDRGAALIAWDKVCKPKEQGGLDVLDLTIHNKCLLMKHVHKFVNKYNLPWVNLIWSTYYPNGIIHDRKVGSFWWKDICKNLAQYKILNICTIGRGDIIYTWQDNWGQGIMRDNIHSYIHLPLTNTALYHNT